MLVRRVTALLSKKAITVPVREKANAAQEPATSQVPGAGKRPGTFEAEASD